MPRLLPGAARLLQPGLLQKPSYGCVQEFQTSGWREQITEPRNMHKHEQPPPPHPEEAANMDPQGKLTSSHAHPRICSKHAMHIARQAFPEPRCDAYLRWLEEQDKLFKQ